MAVVGHARKPHQRTVAATGGGTTSSTRYRLCLTFAICPGVGTVVASMPILFYRFVTTNVKAVNHRSRITDNLIAAVEPPQPHTAPAPTAAMRGLTESRFDRRNR